MAIDRRAYIPTYSWFTGVWSVPFRVFLLLKIRVMQMKKKKHFIIRIYIMEVRIPNVIFDRENGLSIQTCYV